MKIINPQLSGSVYASGSFVLPSGRADQRPTSPPSGSLFFEISDSGSNLVVYNGSGSNGWEIVGKQTTPVASVGPAIADIEYLVVAGGGGGGGEHGGGGGAGGYLSSSLSSIESGSSITVTVGGGGANGGYARPASPTHGSNGDDSSIASLTGTSFTTVTTYGGGGSGGRYYSGVDGGSGGGAGGEGTAGGSGTIGQGFGGGIGAAGAPEYNGGGGGGAGASGIDASNTGPVAGDGGDGKQSSITGTTTYYAGGGGGCAFFTSTGYGDGGQGGGGRGATNTALALSGTANTGGGGGGANRYASSTNHQASSIGAGGNGGSGVAIFAYDSGSINAAGGIVGDAGNGRKYHQFNQSGTFKVGSTSNFGIVTSNLIINVDASNLTSYSGTGNTWTDLSGNANNFTLRNSPSYSTPLGGVFTLNGSNQDFLLGTTPTELQGNPNLTVSGWFRRTGNLINGQGAWGIGGNVTNEGICAWNQSNTNEITIDVWSSGTFTSGVEYTLNDWTFVTWQKIAGDMTRANCILWKNLTSYTGNALTILRSETGVPNINTQGVCIGRIHSSYDPPLPLQVAHFMVYDRVLTAAEVTQNYNATKTNFV